MSENSETKHSDAVDIVLRKIGRNMVLFQQFESLLKYIISNSSLSAKSSQLEQPKAKARKSTQKQTLGTLVGQYVENILVSDVDDSKPDPETITEPYFSFRFRINPGDTFREEIKTTLSKLVIDRNQLVHHLLPSLDTNSTESCD